MASVGFAVGLGNIWRFPYVTGENGGAAFVLVYLVCAITIGVPIVMAEILIGRRGRAGTVGSMRAVASQEGRSPAWERVGNMNLLAAFVIQITYSVICGLVLWYLFKAITTGFSGWDGTVTATEYSEVTADTAGLLFWMVASLVVAGGIVYGGVKGGIERAVIIMMPMLFLLLVVLVIFNMFAGGFDTAIRWLFARTSPRSTAVYS